MREKQRKGSPQYEEHAVRSGVEFHGSDVDEFNNNGREGVDCARSKDATNQMNPCYNAS